MNESARNNLADQEPTAVNESASHVNHAEPKPVSTPSKNLADNSIKERIITLEVQGVQTKEEISGLKKEY
jgi:hypothetical protein